MPIKGRCAERLPRRHVLVREGRDLGGFDVPSSRGGGQGARLKRHVLVTEGRDFGGFDIT